MSMRYIEERFCVNPIASSHTAARGKSSKNEVNERIVITAYHTMNTAISHIGNSMLFRFKMKLTTVCTIARKTTPPT